MNEKDQNFEDLKQLLKLKRHEVPPPGYFNNFSGNVISRIRAGEASSRQTFAERMQSEVPWLMNFVRAFETRPGLIGGFATSLCLLLVLGVVFAEHSERAAKNILAIAESPAQPASSALASLTAPTTTLMTASDSTGIVASTNPIASLQPVATLFGQAGGSSLFQPASFAPAH